MNLRIAIWNANGLSNHKAEAETFVNLHFIDIFLISETHFNKFFFKSMVLTSYIVIIQMTGIMVDQLY